ncbi:FecR family protein [Gracilimonas sp.]|uniref:FecR family protein n=1 Tax=Gracilimonas sp. TaxID=1974203 RepID=UPI0028729C9D|nr:FecR domain-containing protein [Gracilimonas sp.]
MSFNSDYDDIDWNILAKYFSGNASEAETNTIKEWVNSSAENKTKFENAREAWEASKTTRQVWDTEAAWAKLNNQIREKERASAPIPIPTKRENASSWKHYLKVAAILLFAVLVGVLSFQNKQVKKSLAIEEAAPVKEFSNQKGQRSTLNLPDNSKVYLAADSRLILQPDFNDKNRKVFIEGEAYFEITKNADLPFIVETNHGRIEVLGTKFNVNAFPETNQQEVAVTEGKVAFSSNQSTQNATILTAGKLGILSFDSKTVSVQSIEDLDYHTGWITGKLVFKDTALPTVIKKLERWYDIDIKSTIGEEEMGKKELASTFKNQQLNEVLEAISLSLDINLSKKDNTYTFSQK